MLQVHFNTNTHVGACSDVGEIIACMLYAELAFTLAFVGVGHLPAQCQQMLVIINTNHKGELCHEYS